MNRTIQRYSAGGIVFSEGKVLAIKVTPHNEVIFPKRTIDEGEDHKSIQQVCYFGADVPVAFSAEDLKNKV